MPWVGGLIQFLPGLLVAGLVVFCASMKRPRTGNLKRGASVLTTFYVTVLLLSAGKLLPMWLWIPITSRAEGLDKEVALQHSLSLAEALEWFVRQGWVPVALCLAALVLRVRRRFD